MPQMFPMNWFILLLFFSFNILLMLSLLNSLIHTSSPSHYTKNSYVPSLKWMW